MATSRPNSISRKSHAPTASARPTIAHRRRRGRAAPLIEPLDRRVMLSVTATFSPAQGVLTVTGDDQDNTVALSLDVAGTIRVNGGTVPVQGGAPTAANTTLIQISGLGGNDDLAWSRSANLPRALVNGGAGNDTLNSGTGDDTLVGGAGDDTFLWSPGNGNDILDGVTGDGTTGADRLVVNGSDLAEEFNLFADGNGGVITRDLDDVRLDFVDVETIDLNANGGADTVTVGDLSATPTTAVNLDLGTAADGAADAVTVTGTAGNDDIGVSIAGLRVIGLHAPVALANLAANDALTIDAGAGDDNVAAASILAGAFRLTQLGAAGNDTLVGSRGDDTLVGGDGDDVILGFRGADTALMGAGNDTFEWDQGDGSDVLDGQGGHDTLHFIGSNDAETFGLAASGNHARLLRTLPAAADVTMDLNAVEQLDLDARGGADTIIVNDLTATDLTTLNLDLDSAEGTGAGDNAVDAVTVNATAASDAVQIASFGLRVAIAGLFPFVNITGEGGLDTLAVHTLGGDDIVDAANLAATNASQLLALTLDGGAGNDTLIGSQGFDTFLWNPGDGSDTIDGGAGPDSLILNGSDLSEKFALSANGARTLITRDLGGVSIDLGGVEAVTVNALGGADAFTVNDLTGTPVTRIDLNLAATPGGAAPDGQVDSTVVNGANAADAIPVAGAGGLIVVGDAGSLPYFLVIRAAEAIDALQINGNGGNDTIDASPLQTPVHFTANGGAGNDTLLGGAGDDTFLWNPGDGSDTVEGHAGTDTLNFNASAADDNITLSANGPRLRLTDTVGTIALDVDGVEQAAVALAVGADNALVNNLAGTALTNLKVIFSADAQPDTLTLNGSDLADAITAAGDLANGVTVTGLAAQVRLVGLIGPTDALRLNGGAAGDRILADLDLPMLLSIDGGAGQDLIDIDRTAPDAAVRILPSTGDDTVNIATGDTAGPANVSFDATQRLGALNIGDTGAATLAPGGATTLTITSLDITGDGTLNLRDNNLILDYTGPSPIDTIQSLLKSGYNAGAWNGTGITSNLANASTFSLGFAEASDGAPNGQFAGQAVDGTALLIKFTRYGDANLDGRVNFDDLLRLARHFTATPTIWSQGDFNFDGKTDFGDLLLLARNYNATLATAPQSDLF